MSHTEVMKPVDRAGWKRGPWDEEPDRLQWKTVGGMVGLIVRSRAGALCGYVACPPGHKHYEVGYGDVDVDVHGGLTYSGFCMGGICHVPDPGEPERVWWLGFDCAHPGDRVPGYEARGLEMGGVYCRLAYVKGEVEKLAEQLSAA